jgi:hypothetical protein
MSDTITLTFPDDVPAETRRALEQELAALDEVDDVTPVATRAIDPGVLKLWVEVAATTLPVLTGIVSLLRSRGLKNVTVTTAKGTITVGEGSAADIRKLLE